MYLYSLVTINLQCLQKIGGPAGGCVALAGFEPIGLIGGPRFGWKNQATI